MYANTKSIDTRPRSNKIKSTKFQNNSKENDSYNLRYKSVKQLSYDNYHEPIDTSNCKRYPKPLTMNIIYKPKENQTIFKPSSKDVKTKLANEDPIDAEVIDDAKPKRLIACSCDFDPLMNTKKHSQPLMLKTNSIGRLEKQLKTVESLTINDDEDARKTFEEKVTRQVNFPAEKKLYKNLIPLVKTEKKKPMTICTNHEFTIREKEPKLEDYFTPESANEYAAVTRITLPHPITIRQFDGRAVHKRIMSWKIPFIVKVNKYL